MVLAQTYLDKEYPIETRGSITELIVAYKKLEGCLDLRDFVNLRKLNCNLNLLINIDLSKNIKLEFVTLYQNKISANLSIFSHLTNLKMLDLGTETGSYNDFHGSLKSLENLTELNWLCIGQNKKITEGLEYLPTEKLTHFGCHGTIFEEMLKPYGLGHKGLKKWKEVILTTSFSPPTQSLLFREKEKYWNATRAIDFFQNQQNQLTTKKSELEQNITNFKNKITELGENISTLTNERDQLTEKINSYEKAATEAITKISANQTKMLKSSEGVSLDELKIKHDEIQKEYEKLLVSLELQTTMLTERDKELESKNEALKNKEAKLNSLQDQKNNVDQQLKSKGLELSQKTAEISTLKKEAEAEKSKLENQLKENEVSINSLNTQISNLNSQILTLKAEITKKETSISALEANLLKKEKDLKVDFNKEQETTRQELQRIRKRSDKSFTPLGFTYSKNLKDEIELWKIEMVSNEQHLPTRGYIFREFIGFNWLSNKIGSAYSMAIFAAAVPTIFTGLGYLLKSYFKAKSNVVHGAYQVANGMINHSGGNNLPPSNQPLPPTNHYLPPQPLPEATQNLPPVINNHYHTSPVEKKTRKVQKKKTNSS